MASPVVATVGTTAESFGATVSCPPPASIANGDLLIACVVAQNNDALDATGTGWTNKLSFTSATNVKFSLLYKYAASESGNYVFTMTNANFMDGVVMRITGAVTAGDPFDAIGTGDNGASTTATASAITTGTADTLLLYFSTWVLGATTVTTGPSGMTLQATNTTQSIWSQAIAATGSTGTRAATLSGSDSWEAVIGAIKSSSGTTPVSPLFFQNKPTFVDESIIQL